MNLIAIYTLTSELHDERTEQREPSELARRRPSSDGRRQSQQAVAAVTHEFLTSLHIDYDLPATKKPCWRMSWVLSMLDDAHYQQGAGNPCCPKLL